MYRPWLVEDLEQFTNIYSDARVTRFIGGPIKNNDYLKRLKYFQARHGGHKNMGAFATCLKSNHEIIGAAFIGPLKDGDDQFLEEIEIGWTLGLKHWGQGFGTEMGFALKKYGQSLGLKTIHAVVNLENHASRKICEKIGMSYIGISDRYYGVETHHFILEFT